MIKSILTAAACLAMVSPVAFADDAREDIQVTISYDRSDVDQDAIVSTVEKQARQACTFERYGSNVRSVDYVCVEQVVEGALTEIAAKTTEAG